MEIKEGKSYFDEVIEAGRIKGSAIDFVKALNANLETEERYYEEHVKKEIQRDLAYQRSEGASETDEQLFARKLAARHAQLAYLTERKNILNGFKRRFTYFPVFKSLTPINRISKEYVRRVAFCFPSIIEYYVYNSSNRINIHPCEKLMSIGIVVIDSRR